MKLTYFALLLMIFLIFAPAYVSAGEIYAESQTEIQWQSGDLIAVVRQVVEWAEPDWSIWLITEGRQTLTSGDATRFGFDLAYMRGIGAGEATLGYHNDPVGENLFYFQYAHPW